MSFKIYLITNLDTGKQYVGQTIRTLENRFSEHSKSSSLLGKDIMKFGENKFKLEIIEECKTKEQANERENFWIAEYGCLIPQGYNRRCGMKSERVSLLMTPQFLDDVSTLAQIKQMTLNEFFCSLAAQAVKKNRQAIDEVKAVMAKVAPSVQTSLYDDD